MGDHAQADLVAERHPAIGVEQVGLVGVHQFLDRRIPVALPLGVGGVPLVVAGFGRGMVEVLVLRVGPVVGHAGHRPGFVRPVAGLEPGEARAEVLGDAEAQPVLPRRLLPLADHVAPRAHGDGVPAVELRVPQEEVVVVAAHADEVAGPGLLVEGHQAVGVPLLGLPQRDDVLVAELRRMAVVLDVVGVVAVAGFVHAARVPIAVHRHRLRAPVRPDAELGVAEPIRTGITLEGIEARLERAVGDGQRAIGRHAGREQGEQAAEGGGADQDVHQAGTGFGLGMTGFGRSTGQWRRTHPRRGSFHRPAAPPAPPVGTRRRSATGQYVAATHSPFWSGAASRADGSAARNSPHPRSERGGVPLQEYVAATHSPSCSGAASRADREWGPQPTAPPLGTRRRSATEYVVAKHSPSCSGAASRADRECGPQLTAPPSERGGVPRGGCSIINEALVSDSLVFAVDCSCKYAADSLKS